METTIEEQLILSNLSLRADVLKIPHHGSKYSSSLCFLRAVKPAIAVMTVGKGIKGIPSEEAIERYRALSIPILRTDIHGFVRIFSDGKKISYKTYK